jgi:hypothetical protein
VAKWNDGSKEPQDRQKGWANSRLGETKVANMLTALILVCSLAATPDLRACDRSNAVHVVQVPEEFAVPAMCAMRGQAFLAETSIGQELAKDERVKIMCIRHMTVGRQAT